MKVLIKTVMIVLLILFVGGSLSAQISESPGNWTTSYKVDPFTDSESRFLFCRSDNGDSSLVFWFDREKDSDSVFFIAYFWLKSPFFLWGDSYPIKLRFDSGEVVNLNVTHEKNQYINFSPLDSYYVLMKTSQSKKLIMGFNDKVYYYDITGLSEIFNSFISENLNVVPIEQVIQNYLNSIKENSNKEEDSIEEGGDL